MSERPPRTESELIELVRSIDVRAPEALHRRVEELVAEQAPRSRRRWSAPAFGFLGAPRALLGASALIAAVAVVLVLSLSGGGTHSLTVSQAAALTLRPATAPAPSESPSGQARLAASVDGVSFPYWQERFGWRASGSRSDGVDGRTVRTVFYSDASGQRVGYAIVAGTPAPSASGGRVERRGATSYRLLSQDGATVVTWLRDGHRCVVSGRGVSAATLLALASWGTASTSA
jgi:hypothetical protein